MPDTTADRSVTVALDLLGGDDAPASVVDGALLGLDQDPQLRVILVGPPDVAAAALADRRPEHAERLRVVGATQLVGMGEDPARAVRAKRDATVRVAARCVRDGAAEACVSVGSTGAAMAAALFTLGRLPGMTRPALAVVVPAAAGPVVVLDVGAGVEASPALLGQFALAGSAYASVRLGLDRPRVGLLTVGSERGKGDPLRKAAAEVLAQLPIHFVGGVEGHDVPLGGAADVIVTDGFTGNVLVKGLEGTYALVVGALGTVPESAASLAPDRLGGAVLLGVAGVTVIGHGAASPGAVASCLAIATQAVREGLVPRTAGALAELVSRRRASAQPPVGAVS